MTDTNTVKACAACAYCKGTDLFLYCMNPAYSYKSKDYIQGVIHTNYSLCVMVRDDENLCGDSAKGWEETSTPKPEYLPNLWSAFKGMIKEFF